MMGNDRSFFSNRGVYAMTILGVMLLAFSTAARAENKIWQERESTKPLIAQGTQPLASLAGLVKELKPAVVNVYTTQVIKPRTRRGMPQLRRQMRDPFFDFFFGGEDPFGFFFDMPQQEMRRSSLGSGFIISPDGYVLTNNHVVAEAAEIKVKLLDERTFPAKVVGRDSKTDVALLKMEVKGKEKLPFAYLGDSDRIEVGDWVIAIGNPFGLGHTVTTGIISAKDRMIGHGPYDDFLQTDAAINPGNSGGPLFDTAGNVVGINTAIVPQGSGIGFAVPINLVKNLLPQLKASGKVTRGWLGVGIQELTPELAENFGTEPQSGVLVSQVYAGSPADQAGIKAGDVIVELDGRRMNNTRQLTNTVASLPPGKKVEVKVLREGKTISLKVELGERDKGEAVALGEEAPTDRSGQLGLALRPLTRELARRLNLDEELRGLVVEDVDPDSPAAGMIQQGDVILEVNRRRVTSLAEFEKAVSSSRDKVLLRLQRGNAQIFLVINK